MPQLATPTSGATNPIQVVFFRANMTTRTTAEANKPIPKPHKTALNKCSPKNRLRKAAKAGESLLCFFSAGTSTTVSSFGFSFSIKHTSFQGHFGRDPKW